MLYDYSVIMAMCVQSLYGDYSWFYDACTCYGLVRQVSKCNTVSVNVQGECRIFDYWVLGHSKVMSKDN